MSAEQQHPTPVSLPAESAIATAYASINLADAFSIELPKEASTDPEVLARFIFAHQAPWISRAKRHLTLSTVVHCNNFLGRLYIFFIAPFHRLVVKSSLRSAARAGWPLRAPTNS